MLSPFKVKSGVPIARKRELYPFELMNIGDHFDAPDDMGEVEGKPLVSGRKPKKSARRHSILASARAYKDRYKPEFSVQTMCTVEDGHKIVRCWRKS